MNAIKTANRLVLRYGVEGAKAKVWDRLFYWTLKGPRIPPVKEYELTDWWQRVGNAVSRNA